MIYREGKLLAVVDHNRKFKKVQEVKDAMDSNKKKFYAVARGIVISTVLAASILSNSFTALAADSNFKIIPPPSVATYSPSGYTEELSLKNAVVTLAKADESVLKKDESILVYVDGKKVDFPDQQPYVDSNNRTMVPVRFVSESLGAEVSWADKTQEVGIDHPGKSIDITLKVGEYEYTINGAVAKMDTKAVLTEQQRVVVPLRFVSEALGAEVRWEVINKNGVVFTFTQNQSDEEIARIIDNVRKELIGQEDSGSGGSVTTPGDYPVYEYEIDINTYGMPVVDPKAGEYGLDGGVSYGTGYVAIGVDTRERDEDKVRYELVRLMVLSGFTEEQGNEVVDYVLTVKLAEDKEKVVSKIFYRDIENDPGRFIRVSSARGSAHVYVVISVSNS